MTTLSQLITTKLSALEPLAIEIVDDSQHHAGHGATGAHVRVTIVSAQFSGKTLIQRHRLVNEALKDELANGTIHALQITAKTPQEAKP